MNLIITLTMELQRIRRRLVQLRMEADVMPSFPYTSDAQEEDELYHDSMNNEDYYDNGSTY